MTMAMPVEDLSLVERRAPNWQARLALIRKTRQLIEWAFGLLRDTEVSFGTDINEEIDDAYNELVGALKKREGELHRRVYNR